MYNKESLLFKFSELIYEKQVNSEKIVDAFKMICDVFSFDCASLYEMEHDTYFNQKEFYCANKFPLIDKFDIGVIDATYRTILSTENVVHVSSCNTNNIFEKELLNLFGAKNVALITLVDEKTRICGIIVLLNFTQCDERSDEDKHTLLLLLSMLCKYTEIRTYQKKLFYSRSALENILDNTGIDIYVNDFYNHDILYVNKSMAEPYGGQERFIGNKCWQVLFPENTGPCDFCPANKIIDENGEPTKFYSWDYQRPFDGSWFRVFSTAFKWADGRIAHAVSSANITENIKNKEMVEYLANFDPLTTLPNRRKLIIDCNNIFNNIKKSENTWILFFDIDGFKAVNDTYGHNIGDEFLIALGKFFQSIPLLKDKVYRNGGDEFIAILSGGLTKASIENLYHFIQKRFNDVWVLSGHNIKCGVSVGVSCYQQTGDDAEDVIHKADLAMYSVKKKGGNGISFF